MVLFLHVKRIPTWQVDKQFWASVCVCVVNTFWNTRVCKIGQYRLIKTNIDMKLNMKLNKDNKA